MKKLFSFIMIFVLIFTSGIPYVCAIDEVSVSQVTGMLEGIDTLEQMQDKRSKYTASGHYDITTTNTGTISKHNTARENYETYLADMFEKRAEAQKAYDSLSAEEKTRLDSSLVAKLNNELATSYLIKEYAVTPRDDEYTFEAVDAEAGYAYEVSNYMVSGQIPQIFVLVDTSDKKTTWTPDGEYVYGESNYEVTYCCDMDTGLEQGTDYKRTNLEDSGYFDKDEAQHIRAVLANAYPYVTIDEMKAWLIENGMDEDFVNSLNRADMIAAVQMAVWSYANINDVAADGLGYFASIDIPRNTGLYFTPLHDYTNEMWEWYPGKRTRTFDADAQYRVNALGNFLISLEAVPAKREQIVISEIEVVRTELVSEHDGVCDITVYVTLNGGGDERDKLTITAVSYTENGDGSVTTTGFATENAIHEDNVYSIDLSAKDGDLIKVDIDGEQYLEKSAYFYAPEGDRKASQSLVGISEGLTAVSASKNILFVADLASIPVQDIEIPETKLELEEEETVQLSVSVKPENATNKELIYTSSDDSVVTVDEKGNITAKGEGTAVITIISADKPSIKKEIVVKVAPKKVASSIKHYIVFGKTEKIGWYSVSLDGGKSFQTVFGNSNLEVAEGTELIIKANDILGDPFTFYINGKAVSPDENGYVRVTVDGYMLIGALGIPEVEVPDVDESFNLFDIIAKAFRDFFRWLASLFK